MEIIIYVIVGVILGIIIGLLFGKISYNSKSQANKDEDIQKFNNLDKEFAAFKAKSDEKISASDNRISTKIDEISLLNEDLARKLTEIIEANNSNAICNANLQSANKELADKRGELADYQKELADYQKKLATANADNTSLQHRMEAQKNEMAELNKKFATEFENIANKILDSKTEKFTELNKSNLQNILGPLGTNLDDFRKQINDVYSTESKERFSLGEKVKELVELNHKISEEANNLTKALKGEAKTQGNWGEMILESILERSGLRKNEQYFLEHELKDENGEHILSSHEGRKMRPDAVIKYPDNRNVIIDSKASLNAFTRLVAATDKDTQNTELAAHVKAVKDHITSLSTKGYDDYDKALDFVLMFIPSEPAYIAALQGDPDLWNFAYDKRILLISPTNLITSLKLIVDLWKREDQNRNAQDIADRGAKLYDKFVGFVTDLELVGKSIENAQSNYSEACKKLSTGNDNLIRQATKLKDLGIKTKKEIPSKLLGASNIED